MKTILVKSIGKYVTYCPVSLFFVWGRELFTKENGDFVEKKKLEIPRSDREYRYQQGGSQYKAAVHAIWEDMGYA